MPGRPWQYQVGGNPNPYTYPLPLTLALALALTWEAVGFEARRSDEEAEQLDPLEGEGGLLGRDTGEMQGRCRGDAGEI